MTCFACLSLRCNLTVRTSLAAESYTWYFLIVLRITIDCEVFCFRGFCRFFYISLFLWGAASEPYLYCLDLFNHISPLDTLALWVARILNPAILGLFALGLLDGQPDPADFGAIAWASFLGPGIPSIYAVVAVLTGRWTALFTPDGSQRVVPLILATGSCTLGALYLSGLSAPTHVVVLLAAYALAAAVSAAVTWRWMVSLHTVGAVIPWCLGLLTVSVAYIIFVPVPLLVAWSRVRISEHSLMQVLAGGGLGVGAAVGGWLLIYILG